MTNEMHRHLVMHYTNPEGNTQAVTSSFYFLPPVSFLSIWLIKIYSLNTCHTENITFINI